MKYRDAKLLKVGDFIARKGEPNHLLKITSIEVFGQYKTVKATCIEDGVYVSIFNEEIE